VALHPCCIFNGLCGAALETFSDQPSGAAASPAATASLAGARKPSNRYGFGPGYQRSSASGFTIHAFTRKFSASFSPKENDPISKNGRLTSSFMRLTSGTEVTSFIQVPIMKTGWTTHCSRRQPSPFCFRLSGEAEISSTEGSSTIFPVSNCCHYRLPRRTGQRRRVARRMLRTRRQHLGALTDAVRELEGVGRALWPLRRRHQDLPRPPRRPRRHRAPARTRHQARRLSRRAPKAARAAAGGPVLRQMTHGLTGEEEQCPKANQ
jgi:hypothetical protein